MQQEVERALTQLCAAAVRVHCAGRTDTGVHATAQWVHFDLPASRSLKACVVGANAQLPASVRVADARVVAADFHARHSARRRSYDYLIANTSVAPALLAQRCLWFRDALDTDAMEQSLTALLGEQDFSAFRAAACQSRTPMRYLEAANVWRSGDFVQVRLTANAFLHHMVRNIVGSLLEVGRGERGPDWLAHLLASRDRTLAAATAPPHGLYLTAVDYPAEHAIPGIPRPPFLSEPERD